jgi:hypothetical protein
MEHSKYGPYIQTDIKKNIHLPGFLSPVLFILK